MNNLFFEMNSLEFLKQTRTIYLFGEINAEVARDICVKLKYLNFIDDEKEIFLEINSPGGEISSGYAIHDTIKYIKAPVKMIVCGSADSMAAFLVACNRKGCRYALPHSRIMIHQPLGGLGMAQASDIQIFATNINKVKLMINEELALATGKSIEEISKDTERDYYMTAYEAVEYGILDGVIECGKD